MASIGFLVGGALINALAFSSSYFLFSSLKNQLIKNKRDKAIENLQRAQTEWAKKRQE